MNGELSELWNKCLRDIELEVSKPNFSTWFKHTVVLRDDGGTIGVGVPNEFVKDWLSNKYHKLILKTLVGHMEHIRAVEFVITKTSDRIKQDEAAKGVLFRGTRELPLHDLYINKEDNLNPRYTFDSFIVGSFNELAHAAGQAIVTRPGIAYNPLFVYGASGIGKTHLIQAVGNAIKTKHPEKKVHYTTLEKFSIDYVNSVQNNKGNGNSFKEKYRKFDVIIMDDIQFITGKERTQEELFHLFNNLYDNNKQIIFSSDKHPNFIIGLEDRLRSRLSHGMTVDINEPDYESRVALLQTKSKENGLSLPDEVIAYIAEVIQGNIRELEGCINAILCQSQIKNHQLSVAEVKNLLKNNIRPKKTASTKEVVKVVADYYNIEEESIYEKTRRKEIVKARQMIMYILREEFNVSYSLIGQKLGGKDHTTVIHSCEKIKTDLKRDPLLVQEFDELKAMFK